MTNKLITTTELALLLGAGISKEFGGGQPCSLGLRPGGTSAPMIQKNAAGYFEIEDTLLLDVKCLPSNFTGNATKDDYLQATTLELDFGVNFNFTLGYDVLVKAGFVDSQKLKLKMTNSYNTTFNMNSKFRINIALGLATSVIDGALQTIFDHGLVIDNVFNETAICWLDIRQIYFKPDYVKPYQWGGLTLGYWTEMCPDGQPWGPWTTAPLKE